MPLRRLAGALRRPDQDMRRSRNFDVKEVYALAENLRLGPFRSRGAAARAGVRYAVQGLSEYLVGLCMANLISPQSPPS